MSLKSRENLQAQKEVIKNETAANANTATRIGQMFEDQNDSFVHKEDKDAPSGYAGLTDFKINFKNVVGNIISFFTNSNTVARTYTFQDRNGTIADDTDISEARAYAESLVTGLWDDRGAYDASGNTFPASGGSGSAGAILKGDIWTIEEPGTLGGLAVIAGQTVRALVDTPGQTAGSWAISVGSSEVANASETVAGKVEKASSSEIVSGAGTGTTGAPLFIGPQVISQTLGNASDKIPSEAAVTSALGAENVAWKLYMTSNYI